LGTVTAGTGNITVVGGDTADTIAVGTLATAGQTFTGSVSKFAVTGGAGAQTIVTGAAADTIIGGLGADILTGGITGIDIFKYATGATDAGDTITDFTSGTDIIQLVHASLTKAYIEVAATSTGFSANANVIVMGTTSAITIDAAATAIAGDADIVATEGYIVVPDGSGNAQVYYSTDLGANGTETLLVTLTGIANVSSLDTADFIVVTS
jgi:Ca2+-binding RTX toxin-like protein